MYRARTHPAIATNAISNITTPSFRRHGFRKFHTIQKSVSERSSQKLIPIESLTDRLPLASFPL
jgi:flagellar basal body rod protein FlgB